MQSLLFIAVVLLPGLKPLAQCPRPILVNINLNHKIDRLVFKRTFYKCRRQYRKSPCLVRLTQPQKGSFHAICGETQEGLKDGISIHPEIRDIPAEGAFVPNCSSEIFANYLTADWSTFQTYPVVTEVHVNFCESLDIKN